MASSDNIAQPSEDRLEDLVSIILATGRDSGYLREALDSVRAQTYANWELLIVENGAAHPEKIADLISGEPRMSLISIDHSATAGLARNIGVANTRGHLITFIDDDDVWHVERLATHIEVHRRNPATSVSFSGFWYMDAEGTPFGAPWMSRQTPSRDILRGAAPTPYGGSLMVTRDVYTTIGGCSPEIPMLVDFELALRLALQGDFVYIDRALFGYRRHDSNMTSNQPRTMRRGRTIMEYMIDRQRWAAEYGGAHDIAQLLDERLRRFRTSEGQAAAVTVLRRLRRRDIRSVGADAWWALQRSPLAFMQRLASTVFRKPFTRRGHD